MLASADWTLATDRGGAAAAAAGLRTDSTSCQRCLAFASCAHRRSLLVSAGQRRAPHHIRADVATPGSDGLALSMLLARARLVRMPQL